MKHLCLLLFFFTLSLQAQFQVNGIVKDISTNKPLPFATITGNDGTNTISDVDGKFIILSKMTITAFEVSYIGFTKIRISIEKGKSYYVVALSQKANDLNEIIISNENPALAIIRKTIAQKDNNNPQRKLKTFEFKSYNKLIVTANPDSISGKIDSVFVEKTTTKIDFFQLQIQRNNKQTAFVSNRKSIAIPIQQCETKRNYFRHKNGRFQAAFI